MAGIQRDFHSFVHFHPALSEEFNGLVFQSVITPLLEAILNITNTIITTALKYISIYSVAQIGIHHWASLLLEILMFDSFQTKLIAD